MAMDKPKVAAADQDGALINFLSSNRQLIVGGTLFVIVAVGLVVFLSSRSQANENEAWSSFLELQEQSATVDEMRAKLDTFEGTDAEPWVLYNIALREYEDENVEEGLKLLERLQSEFPDHYLNRTNNSSGETKLVAGLISSFKEQIDWTKSHTAIESNPDPSGDYNVVLKTSEGDLTIGLYFEQSPESCKAFLAMLPAYKGMAFKSLAGRNIVGGEGVEEGDGLSEAIESRWDDFPPIEENKLFHFQDAVSFRAPTGVDESPDGSILFCLDDNFTEDGRQTVFGQLTDGIPVLQALSEGETDPENPGTLLTPVIIEDVQANVPADLDLTALQAETVKWLEAKAEMDDSAEEDGDDGSNDEDSGDEDSDG